MFDQEPVQQRLSSANSVNSIVSQVAKTIEQEEEGRVAAWAVNFDKLLRDQIGITVFTVSFTHFLAGSSYFSQTPVDQDPHRFPFRK